MKILGLDQSLTRCGWCLLTGTRAQLAFELGHFKSEHVLSFAVQLVELLDRLEPAFVVWERPNPRVMIYNKKSLFGGSTTPNAAQLVLPQIAGMIEMACILRALPYEHVASNTWRASVIGKGAGNLATDAAKKRAMETCRQLKIGAKNADQAEAALIALYGLSCDRYRMLDRDQEAALRRDFDDWQKVRENGPKSGAE